MRLEDQVCSLELAKKLKKLGVKQDSLYKWYHMMNGEWYLQKPKFQGAVSGVHGNYSAFTVEELGEMLKTIFEENNYGLLYEAYGECFDFKGTQRIGDIGIINLMIKPDMGAEMLIYLIEKKSIEI